MNHLCLPAAAAGSIENSADSPLFCFIAPRLSNILSTIQPRKHPHPLSMSPDTALTVRTRRDLILATNNKVESQVRHAAFLIACIRCVCIA